MHSVAQECVAIVGFRIILLSFCLDCLESLICVKPAIKVIVDMGVSENRGTPKWMVYNGKPY